MNSRIVDAVVTALKNAEELAYPNAVLLKNFPRSIQLGYHSCSAKSVYTILRYYKKRCTPASIEQQLKTDENGTSISDIKRVLRERKLSFREFHSARLMDLEKAIDSGRPCLISMYGSWHYGVVYGHSDKHVFVMNPSLNPDSMGSVWCAVKKNKFVKSWDRWTLIVRPQ